MKRQPLAKTKRPSLPLSLPTQVVGQASRSFVSSLRSTADGSIRPDAKDIKPEDGEADEHGPARVSEWYQTSFNLMAEVSASECMMRPSRRLEGRLTT